MDKACKVSSEQPPLMFSEKHYSKDGHFDDKNFGQSDFEMEKFK